MDEDPAEVTYKVSQLDSSNFDLSNSDEDVPVIVNEDDGKLYIKYIVYCGQSEARLHLKADQNIARSNFRRAWFARIICTGLGWCC